MARNLPRKLPRRPARSQMQLSFAFDAGGGHFLLAQLLTLARMRIINAQARRELRSSPAGQNKIDAKAPVGLVKEKPHADENDV